MKNTASRFQVVDQAIRNPGTCLLTQTPTGPFIDTGLDLGLGDRGAFRGRVYLSVDAVREMAEQFGLFDSYEQKVLDTHESADTEVGKAWDAGYAAGRAENLDHLADELVDRMRARVGGNRPDRAVAEVAGEDDPAAAAPAGPGAEAPVVEEPAGVPVAGRSKRAPAA